MSNFALDGRRSRAVDLATQIIGRDPSSPLQDDERRLIARLLSDPSEYPATFRRTITDWAITDGPAQIPLHQLQFEGFKSYVPVWSGTGGSPTLGNGTITGRYRHFGKQVRVMVKVTLGSTTAFGTTSTTISLPIAPVQVVPHGSAIYVDTSAGSLYPGIVRQTGSAVFLFNTASPLAFVTATAPFTWASTDTIEFHILYEVA